MNAGYWIDLDKISLKTFKNMLKTMAILPSRKAISEELDVRFALFESRGLDTLGALLRAIEKEPHLKAFAEKTGVPEGYYVLLRREISSYHPKPVNLEDFPGLTPEVLAAFKQLGIKNTKQLYEAYGTSEGRALLKERLVITEEQLEEAVYMGDLCRIRWVGATFARMIYDAGVKGCQALAVANSKVLYKKLMELNKDNQYTKGRFSVKDMAMCIEFAQLLNK